MTTSSPRQDRLTQIATQDAEAERLLVTARDDKLKAQVRLAVRDLDEAREWLLQEHVEERPAILTIVDMALKLATWRLSMVAAALDKYGPDATLIG